MIQRAQARNIFLCLSNINLHTLIQNFSESVYFLKKMSILRNYFYCCFTTTHHKNDLVRAKSNNMQIIFKEELCAIDTSIRIDH